MLESKRQMLSQLLVFYAQSTGIHPKATGWGWGAGGRRAVDWRSLTRNHPNNRNLRNWPATNLPLSPSPSLPPTDPCPPPPHHPATSLSLLSFSCSQTLSLSLSLSLECSLDDSQQCMRCTAKCIMCVTQVTRLDATIGQDTDSGLREKVSAITITVTVTRVYATVFKLFDPLSTV